MSINHYEIDEIIIRARITWSMYWSFRIYLILTILFCLSEPIIVAFGKEHINYQIGILAASTLLYFVNILFSFYFIGETNHFKIPTFKKLKLVMDTEMIFELFCLAIGWIFIFPNKGLACLRCFRVFRLLWFFEIYQKDIPDSYDPSRSLLIFNPSQGIRLCLAYIRNIVVELFTVKSRGGVIVIGIFIYMSYVFAVIFNYEQNGLVVAGTSPCSSISKCFFMLVRLSFYDGNGFDFLYEVFLNNVYQGIALSTYMIFTGIILLNGLIAIFGNAFNNEEKEKSKEDILLDKLKSLEEGMNLIKQKLA